MTQWVISKASWVKENPHEDDAPNTCRNVPSFTRVPQMILVGFAAFVMENVPSVTMCLDQCTKYVLYSNFFIFNIFKIFIFFFEAVLMVEGRG
ncbi:unnamed protein product [Nippostrongylus brasiliensis]|uniref:Transmembrane protein n=1 Tax=Nippostrongylus brasiliensis TaxID=27835 RepID=A0A0N4YYM4_NIPBR|nr:unnamed protein product [Nippostrongylus brasiliensis]